MRESTGPYFIDQDGDTIIIGPGVNADAPDGLAKVDTLTLYLYEQLDELTDSRATKERICDEVIDAVLVLMNLAYTEGGKSNA